MTKVGKYIYVFKYNTKFFSAVTLDGGLCMIFFHLLYIFSNFSVKPVSLKIHSIIVYTLKQPRY